MTTTNTAKKNPRRRKAAPTTPADGATWLHPTERPTTPWKRSTWWKGGAVPPDPRMLGKLAAKSDTRTLRLAAYLTGLPIAPRAVDWAALVAIWPMMANDTTPDCTIAAAGHMVQAWAKNAGGLDAEIPDAQILAAYRKVAAPGGGAFLLDVLKFWRRSGIGGHTIGAFASVEPTNHEHVRSTVDLFGGAYIGLQLPVSAQRQRVWSVTHQGGEPGSWGGHCVPVLEYDRHGLTCITWGREQRFTWGFLSRYCDEAFAVFSNDWIEANGEAPSGVDVQQLLADLAQL